MSAKTFTCTLQVRWGDSDRLGHVNNTRFVEYLQEGRVRFLNAVFGGPGVRGAAVVRKLTTDFLHPILDDSGPLTIELWITRIGTTSYGVRHVVTDRDGKVCADAEALMVAFDLATSSSRPLSEDERNLLAEYLVAK
ncbi:acyl-CoA thioesterase [Rhodococcus sp. IEGM 1401]|uniref:acyl-CoA thioesterase n=1 Tax=unclassified Rhodococcus (in: high G+C Gram-positive bacteria) TaxID=192944 RepID=UPI0022B4D3A2|nr:MULTISPECIES: acyl-CoA thioesterase [unclassified Rhodococcus (in: high G+C Gram-positive bacteria)]MCZ4559729.1 acyl-CoA thioesterase [Rhodococcus sp. IEGM 1401]MDI9920227.1 acyl-CoA thioesterase [Rhodococcus sp. IEGM 1372]MDI9928380.1 acyl-CoA thioesterase [Rhodococcus sp. IEGM 1341]MDV8032309.1 acyl-CoA thioesterase [Rhodococcus sp. IEGM 1414]